MVYGIGDGQCQIYLIGNISYINKILAILVILIPIV